MEKLETSGAVCREIREGRGGERKRTKEEREKKERERKKKKEGGKEKRKKEILSPFLLPRGENQPNLVYLFPVHYPRTYNLLNLCY